MRRSVQLGLVLVLLTSLSAVAEIARLRNGFTIRHDRREVIGDKTRLYTAGGFVEIPTVEIVDIEQEDVPVAAPELKSEKTIPDHVFDASRSTGIDPDFLNSVIHHESAFNPRAVSKKGAKGLMQLMPETADQLGVRDSFDPGQNIRGGAAYLRQLLVQYNGDAQKALAAYNAGPHRVKEFNGVPPYRETRAYVAGIIREYNGKKLAEQRTARTVKQPSRKLVKKGAVEIAPQQKPAS